MNLQNIYLTVGARECLTDIEVAILLERFMLKDFGDLCEEDVAQNIRSIKSNYGMVMGSYVIDDEDKIWIITHLGEGGYTTILLPEEY